MFYWEKIICFCFVFFGGEEEDWGLSDRTTNFTIFELHEQGQKRWLLSRLVSSSVVYQQPF